MGFLTPTERVFLQRVKVDVKDLAYVERGIDFIRFRIGADLYEVSVKIKKKKI